MASFILSSRLCSNTEASRDGAESCAIKAGSKRMNEEKSREPKRRDTFTIICVVNYESSTIVIGSIEASVYKIRSRVCLA